jgi:hypothetical protein
MDKEEVIKILEQGAEWEDKFVLDYDKDVVWELLKTLEEEKFNRIKPLLDENIKDSVKHASMIKAIIEKLRSGEYEL